MNCRETRKWLSPYLDSELEQTKTFEVSEHLRVCPGCAERFEAERNAEQLVRRSLERETMPGELWQRITHDVATPPWVRRLGARTTLALAAAIVLAFLVWGVLPNRSVEASPAWLAESFVAETPDNSPFVDAHSSAARAMRTLRDALHLGMTSMPSTAARTGHFGFELISTQRLVDASGRTLVEVRLNCCGQPVLLAFAQTDAQGKSSLDDMLKPTLADAPAFQHLNVDARRIGSVVAVALSRHPVAGILENVSPINNG